MYRGEGESGESREPLVVSLDQHDETETLSIGSLSSIRFGTDRKINFHLSVSSLHRLLAAIDGRILLHDAKTLAMSPATYKLRWFPSLLRSVLRLLPPLVDLLHFHLRRCFQGAVRAKRVSKLQAPMKPRVSQNP